MTTPTREELLRMAEKSGGVTGKGWLFDESDIERFAALHAEWLSAHQAQEPICRVVGFHAGRCVVEPFNRSMVLPVGMALYASNQAHCVGLLTNGIASTRLLLKVPPKNKAFNDAWPGGLEEIDSAIKTSSHQARGDQVWNEAVEASAKACEIPVHEVGHPGTAFKVQSMCIDTIRSLKRPLQAQEQKCDKCSGTGIGDYFDHGYAHHGEAALEAVRCDKCDGFGHASASGAVDSQPSTVTDEMPNAAPALFKYVDEQLEGYEFRGDSGDYIPNEQEQLLINDFVNGLLADDDFIRLVSTLSRAQIAPTDSSAWSALQAIIDHPIAGQNIDAANMKLIAVRTMAGEMAQTAPSGQPAQAEGVPEYFVQVPLSFLTPEQRAHPDALKQLQIVDPHSSQPVAQSKGDNK